MRRTKPAPGEPIWDHWVGDIPEAGLRVRRAAEPGECAQIARALDLIASRLTVAYCITPEASGRFRLTGELHAEVTQACGVTLEPITSTIAERLDVAFLPADDIPSPLTGEVGLEGEDDPEPMLGGRIAVGRVVFEHLAAAIEPYPRKPEAMLEKSSTEGEASAGQGPFAVLASLRTKG